MQSKHQVHNLIILDESGSMESIKNTVIQGFNELVQTMQGIEKEFPEQEHFISLISFNGLGQKILHFIDPIQKLETIDAQHYQPNASTPLYDAMGFGINKLKQVVEGKSNCNVLVTILTDGEENASQEFSGSAIQKMVLDLKALRWTFTYIGTGHDVDKVASALSIDNTLSFKKNRAEMQQMFETEKSARSSYSIKIRLGEDTSKDYYDKGVAPKK